MKLVRFNRDILATGRRGEERVLPDDLADAIVARGEAEVLPSVFDAVLPQAPATSRNPRRRR